VTCRFTGLVAFPHDRISCPMEFGSWSYSDLVTNLTFLNGGFDISPQSPSSGTSYQQYALDGAEAWRTSRFYPCCGTDAFSQLHIRVWMVRQSTAYVLLIEVPGVILTLLSFLSFWLDVTQVGERLGFGVTLLLGNQLLMQIVATVTPLCGEMMWIEIFNWNNFSFCCISIVESVFAIYIAFGGIGTIHERASETCDWYARRVVPLLYAVSLGVIFNATPDDGYTGSYDKPMFQGPARDFTFDWKVFFVPALIIGLAALKCGFDCIPGSKAVVGQAKQSATRRMSGLLKQPGISPDRPTQCTHSALHGRVHCALLTAACALCALLTAACGVFVLQA